MRYIGRVLTGSQIEHSTSIVYKIAFEHWQDFVHRYPIESVFSVKHRATMPYFDEAVWSEKEVEHLLSDFVKHEVGVRGNGWSSVRGKLYGIRHHHIKVGRKDILKDKLYLQGLLLDRSICKI